MENRTRSGTKAEGERQTEFAFLCGESRVARTWAWCDGDVWFHFFCWIIFCSSAVTIAFLVR